MLSNETSFTRWAYIDKAEAIYRYPSASARRLGCLHWSTEDGVPEVYLLLRAHWDAHGHEWIKLRMPARPNGSMGWVRREALGSFHLNDQLIVVNRKRLRVYFYTRGQLRWSAPVGLGAPSTPTPAGRFWIRERFKIDSLSSPYWPYALGTSDYSRLTDWPGGGVVVIHGPASEPGMIPGYISHGCIRLRPNDDRWIAAHASLGTPLHVT